MPIQRSNSFFLNKTKNGGCDYYFQDKIISEAFYIGGTDLLIYKMLGIYDQYVDITDISNVDQVLTSSIPLMPYHNVIRAFDDNNETQFISSTIPTTSNNLFIEIDLGLDETNRALINGVGITAGESGANVRNFTITASIDGATWDNLGTFSSSLAVTMERWSLDTTIYYRFIRITTNDDTWFTQNWKIKHVELYSEPKSNRIQDNLFFENRDIQYSQSPQCVLCQYNPAAKPNDLNKMGFMPVTEELDISVLISDIHQELGRSLIIGDIVALPHVTDDSYDAGGPPTGQPGALYEVIDVFVDANSYDPSWRDHIYTVRVEPLTHKQETYDITGEPSEGFVDQDAIDTVPLVDRDQMLPINYEVSREARNAGEAGKDTSRLYGETNDNFQMDGIPPNEEPYTFGTDFPLSATDGDWFRHEGYEPPKLYNYQVDRWVLKESDIRHAMKYRESPRELIGDAMELPTDNADKVQQPLSKK